MPRKFVVLLLPLALVAYILLGYFTDRTDFVLLISIFSFLFGTYFLWLRFKEQLDLKLALLAGIFFRFSLLFTYPRLSDDYYRFLWDGRLQQLNINPFGYTPSQLIANQYDVFLSQLFPYLNSPDYFSVYPQLLQYIFRLAVELGDQNMLAGVIVLKTVVFVFECGSVLLLVKLLKYYKLSPKLSLIYALNPLVIIELTGNIHFEAVMIFFVLLTAWTLRNLNLAGALAAITLAVQAKLIPLIGIPLLIRKIGFWRSVVFGAACLLLFYASSPFLWGGTDKLLHFFSSLQLYYGKFEFNGSIFSLLRAAGMWILGYNPIYWLSKLMLVCTLSALTFIYRMKLNFLQGFFWLMVAYLLFSAVVHPWYIAILVALSAFTKYRFALIWTALIPLTYITYSSMPYQQNYWLVTAEYLAVLGWFIYEERFRFWPNHHSEETLARQRSILP